MTLAATGNRGFSPERTDPMSIQKPARAGGFALAMLAGGLLAGCAEGLAGFQMQPADPAATARIVRACTASGLFKLADGFALSAVPGGPLAKTVIDAGVDRVCANPAAFAADISTAEWVVKNLSASVRARL